MKISKMEDSYPTTYSLQWGRDVFHSLTSEEKLFQQRRYMKGWKWENCVKNEQFSHSLCSSLSVRIVITSL